ARGAWIGPGAGSTAQRGAACSCGVAAWVVEVIWMSEALLEIEGRMRPPIPAAKTNDAVRSGGQSFQPPAAGNSPPPASVHCLPKR
ncbi:MAG: hypothetical protein WCA21_10655, partial [Terracidiphilus sp.]